MKKSIKAIAIVLLLTMVFTLVACGNNGTEYTDEMAKARLADVVNMIKRGDHIHTEDYVVGMSEEDFEPVAEAIYEVVKDSQYEITHVATTETKDDDKNTAHNAEFVISANGKSITVITVIADGEASIFEIKLK
ncbi:MAG: hypothetical protein IJW19_05730 [Clostridia bacterium]|nr:hypothetical protein [Clostridia bacterium]